VNSAISRIVIKSDHISSHFPKLGQVVALSGAQELYVVMEVDHTNRIAQLMEKSGRHRLIQVPFTRIRTFNRKLAEAIHRFLGASQDPARRR
jgi:hypothetical protein